MKLLQSDHLNKYGPTNQIVFRSQKSAWVIDTKVMLSDRNIREKKYKKPEKCQEMKKKLEKTLERQK